MTTHGMWNEKKRDISWLQERKRDILCTTQNVKEKEERYSWPTGRMREKRDFVAYTWNAEEAERYFMSNTWNAEEGEEEKHFMINTWNTEEERNLISWPTHGMQKKQRDTSRPICGMQKKKKKKDISCPTHGVRRKRNIAWPNTRNAEGQERSFMMNTWKYKRRRREIFHDLYKECRRRTDISWATHAIWTVKEREIFHDQHMECRRSRSRRRRWEILKFVYSWKNLLLIVVSKDRMTQL